MSNESIEQKILELGLTAPRITPKHIVDTVVGETYHVFPDTTLTVCVLTLRNGFTVTGESACAHPSNFSEEIGRTVAKENAMEKIWVLEGYLLREKLYQRAKEEVANDNA